MARTPISGKNKYGLTKEHHKFIVKMIDNGLDLDKTFKEVGHKYSEAHCSTFLARRPYLKRFIYEYMKKAVGPTIEWKLEKLKKVVDETIPDGDWDGKQDIRSGISAISELNRMQGHYSADKLVTTNVNVDLDIESAKKLVGKYEREF